MVKIIIICASRQIPPTWLEDSDSLFYAFVGHVIIGFFGLWKLGSTFQSHPIYCSFFFFVKWLSIPWIPSFEWKIYSEFVTYFWGPIPIDYPSRYVAILPRYHIWKVICTCKWLYVYKFIILHTWYIIYACLHRFINVYMYISYKNGMKIRLIFS